MNLDTTGADQCQAYAESWQLCSKIGRFLPKTWRQGALKSKFRVEEFATDLKLSHKRLQRLCQKRFNCTPKRLLTHLQMLEAVKSLCETSSLEVASSRVGFNRPASFGRRFKACFGVTPKQFLKSKTLDEFQEIAGSCQQRDFVCAVLSATRLDLCPKRCPILDVFCR